jgi:site-specific DNA-methyltransferase (adenine-specific)
VDFEKIYFFVKRKKYYFEQQFENYAPSSDVRYRQRLKTGKIYNSKEPYKKNLPYHSIKRRGNNKDGLCVGGYTEGRNKRCVWSITTKPFKEEHFAVYPEDLIKTPIKAGCPVGGIVLDPFGGSGTTAVVAEKLNRNWILIDLNYNYCQLAQKRILKFRKESSNLFENQNKTYPDIIVFDNKNALI